MSTQRPPRLYKYQPFSSRTLTALKARTVWFGHASQLNDPFDCAVPIRFAPVSIADCARLLAARTEGPWAGLRSDPSYVNAHGEPTELFREAVERSGQKAVRESIEGDQAELGVTCFSETPDSTLLWSHYGGGHRGICLEFDTASPLLGKIHPIRYVDDIPSINPVELLLGEPTETLWGLLTKAACWSYEREWRAIHKKAGTEYCYGIDALTGVYLGAALSTTELDLVAHILHGTPTKLYQVGRSKDSFRLEIRSVSYEPLRYDPKAT